MLNDEKPYLRGAVRVSSTTKNRKPITAEVRKRVMEAYNEVPRAGAGRAAGCPELTDPQLSFQLAQVVPDVDFRAGNAGYAFRSRPDAAAGRVFSQLHHAPAPDSATRAWWRPRMGIPSGRQRVKIHDRQHLIIDADDTLWERTISTSSVRVDEFCDFLAHSSMSAGRSAGGAG